MSLSKHEEQASRLEILENDKALRGASSQGSSFAQFAASEASTPLGRFSAISNPTVIGSTPTPASAYPAAFLQHDPVPDEPALGVDINAMEPVGQPHELKASIASLGPTPAQASPGRSSLISSFVQETPNSSPPETALAGEELGSFSRETFRRF
jgi:hypothetical protein